MTDRLFEIEGRRIWVAGHRGLVGSAVVRRLAREHCQVLTVGRDALDLREQQAVRDWMQRERPDAIILAAAYVGGILANDREPVPFLRDNLEIATNILDAAHKSGVKKLLFLGSARPHPRLGPPPVRAGPLLPRAPQPHQPRDSHP